MKFVIIIIVFFLPVIAYAQDKPLQKRGWRTITSVGMIAGQDKTTPTVQLSGGMTVRHYFVGVGAGYDPYQFQSIPVFADARVYFTRNNAAFTYLNAGYNIPTQHDEPFPESFVTEDRMVGGLYFDAGIGYRVPLKGSHALSFSAGYTQKNTEHRKEYTYPCGINPCTTQTSNSYVYDYKFGRIIVRLSWEWDH